MTNLPSRERAAELADWFEMSVGPKPHKSSLVGRMQDAALLLRAIAAGRLVPVERVAEMRERAAHAAADWPIQWDKERVHDCIGVALAIRALPLDAAPGGTGGA